MAMLWSERRKNMSVEVTEVVGVNKISNSVKTTLKKKTNSIYFNFSLNFNMKNISTIHFSGRQKVVGWLGAVKESDHAADWRPNRKNENRDDCRLPSVQSCSLVDISWLVSFHPSWQVPSPLLQVKSVCTRWAAKVPPASSLLTCEVFRISGFTSCQPSSCPHFITGQIV